MMTVFSSPPENCDLAIWALLLDWNAQFLPYSAIFAQLAFG